MRVLVGSLIAVMILTLGAWFAGLRDLSWMISFFGTLGVFAVVGTWVVAVDSRKRWPDADWLVRLGRVFFFER
jgi:hypothetical protein